MKSKEVLRECRCTNRIEIERCHFLRKIHNIEISTSKTFRLERILRHSYIQFMKELRIACEQKEKTIQAIEMSEAREKQRVEEMSEIYKIEM
jgi:hypothetical protein